MSMVATLLNTGVAPAPIERAPSGAEVIAGIKPGEVVAIRDLAETYGMSWDWAVEMTDKLVAAGELDRAITTGERRGRAGVRLAGGKPEVSMTYLKNATRKQLLAYLREVGRPTRQKRGVPTTGELRQLAYAALQGRRDGV